MATSFSSLALTQVLPFLPLAQGDIDYQTERRGDPNLIKTVLAQDGTTVVFVRDGLLAVPDGQAARVDYETAKIRLAGVPGEYVLRELGDSLDDCEQTGVIAMFLGSYDVSSSHPQAVVALDVSGLAKRCEKDNGNNTGEAADVPSSIVLSRALERFDWVSLLGFAPHASAREAGQATTATALSMWHHSQRHCPRCGSAVRPAMSGWAQQCVNESCEAHSSLLFPRIEPAVITSIVDGQGRLLLQHNKAWKDPSLYSVCAGFVEAGENLEHAIKREAGEETGLQLGEVKYLGSQPWPFPASLMVAFKARALSTDIKVDGRETLEASFFTRDEFTDALTMGRISQPGKATIARYMIEEWYGQEL